MPTRPSASGVRRTWPTSSSFSTLLTEAGGAGLAGGIRRATAWTPLRCHPPPSPTPPPSYRARPRPAPPHPPRPPPPPPVGADVAPPPARPRRRADAHPPLRLGREADVAHLLLLQHLAHGGGRGRLGG